MLCVLWPGQPCGSPWQIAGSAIMPLRLVRRFCPVTSDTLVMIATPIDPPDWPRATEIVCRVVQEKIGSEELRSRELACTAINTTMTCADVTGE